MRPLSICPPPPPRIHRACLVPLPALLLSIPVCLGFAAHAGRLLRFTSFTALNCRDSLVSVGIHVCFAPWICLRGSFLNPFPTLSTSPLGLLPSVSAALGYPASVPSAWCTPLLAGVIPKCRSSRFSTAPCCLCTCSLLLQSLEIESRASSGFFFFFPSLTWLRPFPLSPLTWRQMFAWPLAGLAGWVLGLLVGVRRRTLT